jgi:His/Glu/Gln/Arg/opine family amino acid ABC transporter permease subunit
MKFDTAALLAALPHLVGGLLTTVYLVVVALLIGASIGLITCAGRLIGHGPLAWLAKGYVDMFRGLPETILIFWVYFCGPFVLDVRLSAFASGVLSLSLIAGAHLGEIFRAGVLAVPAGQRDAAKALGLALFPMLAFVIGPQAFRIMLPAFFSHLTILIKNSAIVSAVGVAELFYVGNTIANDNFKHFEVYTAIGLMYLAIILPLSIASKCLERGLAVGRPT